mmetsp:Transcript_71451/g.140296  ORF Transcript_71451/g.140296 Transcript_71451/m.140296 type:complete len:346 (+) Transcript_71451:43-1080(+)
MRQQAASTARAPAAPPGRTRGATSLHCQRPVLALPQVDPRDDLHLRGVQGGAPAVARRELLRAGRGELRGPETGLRRRLGQAENLHALDLGGDLRGWLAPHRSRPQGAVLELEFHVEETLPVLVGLGLVVVDVQAALGLPGGRIQVHVQRVRVERHATGRSAHAALEGHDRARPVVGRDRQQREWYLVHPRFGERAAVEVVPAVTGRQVNIRLRLLGDRRRDAVHKHNVAQHDLILHGLLVAVCHRVREEVPEQRPDHGLAEPVVLLEQGIPQREHLVPELQGGFDVQHRRLVEHIGLAAWRLQVRMVPQERVGEHPELVPAHGHFLARVLEEAADIGADERLAA